MIVSTLDTQTLVEKYMVCADKDSYTAKELAERVLANCAQIASRVAFKFRGTYEDQAELEHIANIAIFDALVLYDSTKETKFETYVRHFISGRIKNFLRDHRTMIRYPAWYRDFTTRKDRIVGKLTFELRRHPQPVEVAQAMHMSLARYQQILDASLKLGIVTDSLDCNVGEPGYSLLTGEEFVCGLDGLAFNRDRNDLFEEAVEYRRQGGTITDFSSKYKLELVMAHNFVKALDTHIASE